MNNFAHPIKIVLKICGLQLPREPQRATRLLQLTDRWQHDGMCTPFQT